MYNNSNPYFNPYFNQKPYQPMEMINQPQNVPIMAQNRLIGKQVESIDIAKNQEVLLDGTISYFPTIDNSAIITKQLRQDGTTKTIIYKPVIEDNNEPKYATIEDIDEIKEEIKEIRKKMKKGE